MPRTPRRRRHKEKKAKAEKGTEEEEQEEEEEEGNKRAEEETADTKQATDAKQATAATAATAATTAAAATTATTATTATAATVTTAESKSRDGSVDPELDCLVRSLETVLVVVDSLQSVWKSRTGHAGTVNDHQFMTAFEGLRDKKLGEDPSLLSWDDIDAAVAAGPWAKDKRICELATRLRRRLVPALDMS